MSEQSSLLKSVGVVGFNLYDLHLFLNTHPDDPSAIALYNNYRQKYLILTAEYERKYGPLTAINGVSDNKWVWIKGPWPWEYRANVEV